MRLTVSSSRALRAFHIGGYWRGVNDIVVQMMLGLRSTGADVFEYSTDAHAEALDTDGRAYDRGTFGPVWLRWDHLEVPIRRFDPHLVICNAGGLAFRPDVAADLRTTRCVLGIALSDPDVFEPTTRQISTTFDYFLTNAPACLRRYEALGVRCGLLRIATNEAIFHPVPPRPEYACDVLILGHAHPDRVDPVKALVAAFDTHVYGERWDEYGLASRGFIFGDDLLAALNSAKITVVFFLTKGGHALVKPGLFDFAAAGALVATNTFAPVEQYFTYGKELIGFDSTPDLLRKIRYYLDHPIEADRIREAGRQRVMRDHTWRQVWPPILQALNQLSA